MKTRFVSRAIAPLAISFVVSISQAAEQPKFDFGKFDNIVTVREKDGGVWFVHYGENKQGHVVYAIFAKGKGPSPVSPGDTLRSDGSREKTLNVQIEGKKIPPPDPEKNSMIIVDGEVKRGQFKPISHDAFWKFLRAKEHLSISSLKEISNKSGEESKEISK